MHVPLAITTLVAVLTIAAASSMQQQPPVVPATASAAANLTASHDEAAGTIAIFRTGEREPLVTQHARPDMRPFLHPIAAPDGRGVATENGPAHHPHQTGSFWGFTRVNGRDYFHNPKGDYWRRVSARILQASGDEIRWQTVYDLLDVAGVAVMTET
ncbi:MAG: DUF6807 family protein, partial [Vicinamibacterales bacterium]